MPVDTDYRGAIILEVEQRLIPIVVDDSPLVTSNDITRKYDV
jgi:hypothetical protein